MPYDESLGAYARARGAWWALAPALALACASGQDGSGFAASFGGLPPGGAEEDGSGSGDPAGSDDEGSTAASDAGPTSGEGTDGGSGPGPGSTTATDDCNPACGAGEICVAGMCTPFGDGSTGEPECSDVPGNYDVCLGAGNVVDVSGCGAMGATCITGGDPAIVGVCSVTACDDVCDCPTAPATGNAPLACDAITGGAQTFCYLDCAAGQTCPTGMLCFADLACVWPGEGVDGVPYGDCLNSGPSTCGLEGLCLNDDVMAPTIGVCTEACASAAACPGSPGGTAPVTCTDVTGDGANECILDCSGGGSCPAGMSCFSGTLCAWS